MDDIDWIECPACGFEDVHEILEPAPLDPLTREVAYGCPVCTMVFLVVFRFQKVRFWTRTCSGYLK